MSTRLIHRPARTTRPPAASEARVIEAPPNLPEGKAGNIAMSLLPVAGVMSSVVMMTVVRNSQFAGLGAIILVVTIIGSVALLFSQRGKAQRTRRTQREAYLAYLEDLREELSAEERQRRERADVLNPPPPALYDIVRDPARLWERRRADADFLRVRVGTGEMPVRDLQIGQQGSSVLTPPDRFMLNEASALMARFRTGTELPLTVPLDRVGNVSVIGPREDCLRVARALLVQAAADARARRRGDGARDARGPARRLGVGEVAAASARHRAVRRPRRRPPHRPLRTPARPAARPRTAPPRLLRGRGAPRPVRQGRPVDDVPAACRRRRAR